MTKQLHHYCIVRSDLDIGTISGQLIHAAGESNPGGKHCHSVALMSDNLEKIEQDLKNSSIDHVAVREPDFPFNNDLLAIGICPCNRSSNKELRRIVSNLPLVKD
jgi:hypothetical protein